MVNKLKKTMLATAAGVAALVGGHAAASPGAPRLPAGGTRNPPLVDHQPLPVLVGRPGRPGRRSQRFPADQGMGNPAAG